MTRLYARTSAEAHLYMDLHPCTCGDIEFDRQSAVITEGELLCSRYAGPCRSCGSPRVFVFELPEAIRPIRNDRVDFGGSDPSRLLDPGEWMAVADYFAKLDPGTPDDLDIACAAVEEILKFVPAGDERVPDEAFRTERGRAVRDAEPGRFRRPRLEAVLGAYRDLVATSSPPPAPKAKSSADSSTAGPQGSPPRALALDQHPLPALVEALANVVAKRQGFQGAELRQHVSDLIGQVQSVIRLFEIKAQAAQHRTQTAAEVERLLEGIVQTGTAAGQAIAAHRETIAQAFRGVDLARISDGLQVLVDWMRNPTDAKLAPVQELIANLQTTLGPMTGSNPEAEDKARRQQVHNEVRASLDQIFGSKAKPR